MPRRNQRRSTALGGSLAGLLGLALLALLQWSGGDLASEPDPLAQALHERRSGVVFETQGTVERVLSDDREGSRHQRFILRLESGQTVLVAHNIDLAPRAPIERGDSIAIRGQYEWNERGGVLHWTHHDPDDRRPGGWIRVGGQLYR